MPVFVPALGVLINATLIVARLTQPAPARHRAPMIAGNHRRLHQLRFYFLIRPTNVTEEVLADGRAGIVTSAAIPLA